MVARRRVSRGWVGSGDKVGRRNGPMPLPGPRPTGGAREAWTGSSWGGDEIPCRAWDGWGREAGRQAGSPDESEE